ncbi:hypothetical protein PRIPAC_94348 [Pristionchus pacificus]|uniref:Uncharacterized protein n=1 Tax=Pristionchus pacificus TaxID=54126 RepID=A0A454XVR6_PRIPA|nr:hypothetical protein PRIPAC_94348 [Pristionchus pacificus]|eukprot:PDM76282.1 hypothetical protein PRIPAC_39886 [Pristionchus pacificus]
MLCSYAEVAPSPPEIKVSEPVDDSDKGPEVPEQKENLLQIPKWDFVLKKEREADTALTPLHFDLILHLA